MVHIETHPRVLVHTESGRLTLADTVLPPMEARRRLQKAFSDEEELELSDILEPIDPRNVKNVVTENLEYVLRREGMLSKDMHPYISEGGYDYDLYGDAQSSGHVSGIFGILRKGGDEVATGAFHGTITFDPPELVDLTVWITQVW